MSAPRDLADAQQRIDQLQSYIDQLADALGCRDTTIERIRALHPDCNDHCGICHLCHEVYPCRTIRILKGKS